MQPPARLEKRHPEEYPPHLAYYAEHGPITAPREWGSTLRRLPEDVRALCQVVQGNLIHAFWGNAYGQSFTEERKADLQLRRVADTMRRLAETSGTPADPLAAMRAPGERIVGNCRHFSTLLVAMLREHGIPARARVGFARYFIPGRYEDHWVCEYWQAAEARWVMVDPQLDAVQREALGIRFDPCDVPRDQFLCAGEAWQGCRSGSVDPDCCGIFDMHGLWFVRGNLVRDVAALNKVELLPWDAWGLIGKLDADVNAEEMALLDEAANLTCRMAEVTGEAGGTSRAAAAAAAAFERLRTLFGTNDRLRVPRIIRSYDEGAPHAVDLGFEA